MQSIGKQYGTDKITHHGYHRFYPHNIDFICSIKNAGMIEIGTLENCSLQMWLQYFPHIFIYGIDISRDETKDVRYHIFKYDQSNPIDIMAFISRIRHPIYFINDDGSHIPEHQILTFNMLFHRVLESGGIYIIEDIEVSYWTKHNIYGYDTHYGLYHPSSLIEKFKHALDYLNREFLHEKNRKQVEQQLIDDGFFLDSVQDIQSITFCQNTILIKKKTLDDMPYMNRSYRFSMNL